jgi:uncharacterized membrane protein
MHMRVVILFLSLAGVVVSSLALRVHISTDTQPCTINERWDCGIVNHSRYSAVEGIPVAAIGLGGYALLGMLAILRRRALLAGLALPALIYALYLTHIEKSILHMWCLDCVISLATISVLTGVAWWWALVSTPDRQSTLADFNRRGEARPAMSTSSSKVFVLS